MTECCNADNSDNKKINYYIPFLLIPFAVVIYIFLERGVDFLVFSGEKYDRIIPTTKTITVSRINTLGVS